MDQSAEHLREISNTLYKYHLDNFLCDVFVVTPDGREVPAHSVVLSAVSRFHIIACIFKLYGLIDRFELVNH
jgi:BTB/POZ domain